MTFYCKGTCYSIEYVFYLAIIEFFEEKKMLEALLEPLDSVLKSYVNRQKYRYHYVGYHVLDSNSRTQNIAVVYEFLMVFVFSDQKKISRIKTPLEKDL